MSSAQVIDYQTSKAFSEDRDRDRDREAEDGLINPSDELLEAVRDAHANIQNLEARRKEINADITAVFDGLQSIGVSKDAAKLAFKLATMDDKTRRHFDLSNVAMRAALGIQRQSDLFFAEKITNAQAGRDMAL